MTEVYRWLQIGRRGVVADYVSEKAAKFRDNVTISTAREDDDREQDYGIADIAGAFFRD